MATRGRKAIDITSVQLQALISAVEKDNSFSNRSALWLAVENTSEAKAVGLSGQVAMMKAKAWQLVIGTPIGKKGRQPGQGMPEGTHTARKESTSKRGRISLEVVAQMKEFYPENVHNIIDRAATGNKKAKLKLNCLSCVGFSKKEVAHCTDYLCGLHTERPYQRG